MLDYQKFDISVCVLFLLLSRAFASLACTLHAHPRDSPKDCLVPDVHFDKYTFITRFEFLCAVFNCDTIKLNANETN